MNEQSWIEEGWFFHNHAWHLLHEFIKNIPDGCENMLDIGGGTGIAASVIHAIYPEICPYVTDIAEESMAFWEKRKINGFIDDGKDLGGFPDIHFDFVMSSHVLEHVNDPVFFIKEAWRVCKKRMMIAVPDGDVHFYDHKAIFDRTCFADIISEALGYKNFGMKFYPVYHPHMNNLVVVVDRI